MVIRMSAQFPVFDIVLKKSGRKPWRWWVCSTEGQVIMRGSESSRAVARHCAYRALFLLLLSAHHQAATDASAKIRSSSG